ncbi:hypothetical protein ACFUCV_12500 [Specibacter sp. NPDC057265]|uniref:hypothetical protein n=1 Tax=Specibacter sp. NPDC057265 TaxID=3346075 RepID=UPI0036294887
MTIHPPNGTDKSEFGGGPQDAVCPLKVPATDGTIDRADVVVFVRSDRLVPGRLMERFGRLNREHPLRTFPDALSIYANFAVKQYLETLVPRLYRTFMEQSPFLVTSGQVKGSQS